MISGRVSIRCTTVNFLAVSATYWEKMIVLNKSEYSAIRKSVNFSSLSFKTKIDKNGCENFCRCLVKISSFCHFSKPT